MLLKLSHHAKCYRANYTLALTNVPDPQRRHEIVEQKAWTFVRLEQVKRQGLGPETVKMQALLRQCDMTLEEMTMMEQYRKDEIYDPPICIEDAGE